MAETSYFWDGTTTGDATLAPYSQDEWALVMSKILGSDDVVGFVSPGYLNELEVVQNSPAAANVLVRSGAAFVKGFNYENTADVTLTVAANASGNPRIDRVVLRISWSAKTVRLVILQGTAAATPSAPALTQTFSTTWEIPLAYIWVANGFTTITTGEIHDERTFMVNYDSTYDAQSEDNLLVNSEFMAFSSLFGSATPSLPPDAWTINNTATFASVTKPAQMHRSRAVQITATAANGGIKQAVMVRGSQAYVLRGLFKVNAGDVGVISIVSDGASPVNVQKNVRITGSYLDYLFYFTTPSDATQVTISLLGLNNTDIVTAGQFLLLPGRVPGFYRVFSESLMYEYGSKTLFTVNAIAAAGTQTINIPTVDTNGSVRNGTRALYVLVAGHYSAGTTDYVKITAQISGGLVSRGTIAVGDTGDEADKNASVVHLLPYLPTKNVEFVIAAAAFPISYVEAGAYLVGILT